MKNAWISILLILGTICSIWGETVWDTPVELANYPNIEFNGSGCQTSDNYTAICWVEGSPPNRNTYIQKYNQQMQPLWQSPVEIAEELKTTSVAETSDGCLVVIGVKTVSDNNWLFAYKIDVNGELVWDESGIMIASNVYEVNSTIFNLVADTSGGLYISWAERGSSGIYLQHIAFDGTVEFGFGGMILAASTSSDYSILLTQDDNLIISYPYYSLSVVKKINPSGATIWTQNIPNTYSVWSTLLEKDNNSDYYVVSRTWYGKSVTKISNWGTFLWAQPVSVVYSTTQIQFFWNGDQVVNTDNSISILWMNGYDIYAQKVDPNGQLLWGANGIIITNIPNNGWDPWGLVFINCLSDGQAGVYVVYGYTFPDDSNPNINMLHVTAQGTCLNQPVFIDDYERTYQHPYLMNVYGNNLFIRWMDKRNDVNGIYAQSLNQQGVKLFGEDGVPIRTGHFGFVSQPSVCGRPNDALIVWLYSPESFNSIQRIQYKVVSQNGTVPEDTASLNSTDAHISELKAVSTPDGYTMIIWTEVNRNEIKAQLLDPQCNQLWEPDGRIIAQTTETLYIYSLYFFEGALYVIWSERDANYHSHVYGQKYINYLPQWPLPGIQLIQENPEYPNSSCSLHSVNGCYLTWGSSDFSHTGVIYALKFDENGMPCPGFNPYGNVVTTLPEYFYEVNVISTLVLQNDLIVVFERWSNQWGYEWKESRAQKISSTGTLQWGNDGIEGVSEHIFAIGNQFLSVSFYYGDVYVTRFNQDGTVADEVTAHCFTNTIDSYGRTYDLLDNGRLLFAGVRVGDPRQLMHWYYDSDDESCYIPSDANIADVTSSVPSFTSKWGSQTLILWMNPYSGMNMYIQLINDTGLGITDDPLPDLDSFELLKNYPNPFKRETTISFNLPKTMDCTLRIYNIKGQLARSLNKGPLSKGANSIGWDGLDEQGTQVSRGVYLLNLSDGRHTKTRKILKLD